MSHEHDTVATRARLDDLVQEHPELRDRIGWALLKELHETGQVELIPPGPDGEPTLEEQVLALAAHHLDDASVDDLVNLTLKREEALSLEEVANLSAVPFSALSEKLRRFCRLPRGRTPIPVEESTSIRVSLIRRFITDQLEFIGVARDHLHIRDFEGIIDRIVGFHDSRGLIGGKAGGMLLGAQILQRAQETDPDAPQVPIRMPESYYLLSDVVEEMVRRNGLQYLRDHKYRDEQEVSAEYPLIRERLARAVMPPEITRRIGDVLREAGDDPLIVRSSSLLEDRFGAVFAGKYESVFVANQGRPEERLQELLSAIVQVYTSMFHPDPISYRKRHQLLDYSETMAVLIQRSVGTRIGPYFLPVWAGVGFGHNLYRRNPRIRPEDGLGRVVFGLGTRAVERVDRDFPRMIPLGMPALRAETRIEDLVRYSQHEVDVVDLRTQGLSTIPLAEVLRHDGVLKGQGYVLSAHRDGFLRPLVGDGVMERPEDMVVTFDRFCSASPYPALLRWCLRTLSKAYGCPVDIEFAYDGDQFYLLQCRPQALPTTDDPVPPPEGIPVERRVFSATRDVVSGVLRDVELVVLIEPRDYNSLSTEEARIRVARCVHKLNSALVGRVFILMGPGRWGSKDRRLGIRVGYADLNNTAMLIEIARATGGHQPEVSYGSHFFQDLVESGIRYLALYPDEEGADWNEELLLSGRGDVLTELLPEFSDLVGVVRVIDLRRATGGKLLRVDMDGEGQRALAYLT
jgi:hypothetical protein